LALALTIAASLALLAWLTLHWGILPRLEQWRPSIEQRASAAIGRPVRIGAIQVHSGSWVPSLVLHHVRLLDHEGRTALELGEMHVSLAVRSLLAMELRFAQLHVAGVQLEVRRDREGRIRVAGLDTEAPASQADDGRAAEWLFSQHEIVVRNGRVRWTDEWRAAPPLELAQVDLVLRNSLRRHQIRLDATPPPEWGERFTLIGQFTQGLLERRGAWRTWSGTLYAHLPAGDVSQLRQHVNLPFDLSEGRGALRAWLDLEKGQWREATADVALSGVSVRLAAHLQPVAIGTLGGRVSATRSADGVQISARRLAFVTGEGLEWPAGDLSLEWRQKQSLLVPAGAASGAAAPVTGGRLRAERLDLGVLGSLAARLPLGRAMESTLQSLSPGGVVSALDLRWTGAPDAPQRYEARGRVARLVLAPQAAAVAGGIGRPGLAGADIDFELSETGGKAALAMKQGALHFPGVFEDPAIALDELQAKVEWRVQAAAGAPPAIELRVHEARFANADAQGDLRATWRTGKLPGFGTGAYLPGEIDLAGRLVRAQAARVATYLPLGIPASVRHYVSRAVRSGDIDNGSFAVKGDAWLFPFQGRRDGVFRIAGRLRDASFDYLPSVPKGAAEPAWDSPWPGFTQVSGELEFDRASMTLDKMQARLWGVQLKDVRARIDTLSNLAVLQVQGNGRGPVSDMLRFVETSPVGQWIGGALEPMKASGAADLRLDLSIPLADARAATVAGSIQLGGNDVQLRPDMPLLAAARGRVDFSHKGFQIVGASARALGGELAFEGGTQADGNLRFTAQGTASAEGLKNAAEFAPLPLVATSLRGQAAWRAALNFVHGHPDLSVTSDLVGLQSDWPAPLDKPAQMTLPLRWQSATAPAATGRAGEATREQLRLDLGNLLQLRLQREWSAGHARVVSGTVGLGESAAPSAPAGVLAVRARLPRLNADAWMRALDRLPAAHDNFAAWPRMQVHAQLQDLTLASRRFAQATIDLQQESTAAEAAWVAQVSAEQGSGRVSWRPPRGPADGGRIVARLARLSLPPSEALEFESALDASAGRPPALDVVVDEFEMRGRKLGRLDLQAAPRDGVAGREWRLDKLDLALPEAHLSATGSWGGPERGGTGGRMALDFGIDLVDSGRLAAHFGWAEAVRGGKGRLQGRLGWNGSPLSPDFPSLEGNINVALEQGQFLRAEPGLGRLLGILSLQSLPRRLLLDFRDVFQQGFAFDQVNGDIAISRGRARTDNLRMRGVQAMVLIEGSADLMRETQDLRVLIVPEMNAAAASLAYVAVNPAIGLGTFLAQLLLRDPLRAANTREFAISGPIAEPKVERIERPISAPLPSAAGSAPAAAPRSTAPAPAERPG
jgi:uncharacterized protein (TIGR02099 family)